MLSVKLLVLDALLENLTALLCRESVPAFFDVYFDLFERLMHTRRTLYVR